MNRASLWLPLVLCAVCGCAGAAPAKAPPASPAAAPANAESPPAGSPATELEGPRAAPSPAPPPVETTQPTQPEAARASARVEMDRAERELDTAAGDCQSACRALASMERATTHLCSLADQDDDRRRCEDARRRLSEARNRVRAACGACP